jgi:nicotinamidase-related amidase
MKMSQAKTALLIIDVQKGLFGKSTPIHRAEELLGNINTLVDRAHRAGAPVFFVQHAGKKTLVKGSDDWRLHPRLHPLETDRVIPKRHVNAFEGTVLETELHSRGIESLVVTGLVTYACVRATCIGANRLGYRVTLARDGHSNYTKNAAEVVEHWNQKLSAAGIVVLKATSEIGFR